MSILYIMIDIEKIVLTSSNVYRSRTVASLCFRKDDIDVDMIL